MRQFDERTHGLSLIEVLIALAVIGIAFAAMAFVQVNNLRASSTARLTSETKAAANQVLEGLMADVLEVRPGPSGLEFSFNDYYWSCPTWANPPSGVTLKPVSCEGEQSLGDVNVKHRIAGEGGILGEGVLTITVTAIHNRGGRSLTIGDRVTCYDIYPSPTATAPEPCPEPVSAGGGRS